MKLFFSPLLSLPVLLPLLGISIVAAEALAQEAKPPVRRAAVVGTNSIVSLLPGSFGSASRGAADTGNAEAIPSRSEASETGTATLDPSHRLDKMSAKLLEKLLEQKQAATNPAFSPVAIATALEALWQGAAGKTAQELAGILEFDENTDPTKLPGTQSTWQWATGLNKTEDWELKHGLWYHQKHPLVPAYLKLLSKGPSLKIAAVDFGDPAAAKALNQWASDQSGGTIDTAVEPSSLSDLTRMVWISLLNYEGKWSQPFDPENTKPGVFRTASGELSVPMMHGKMLATVRPGGKGWSLIHFAMQEKGSTTLEVRLPDKPLHGKQLAALLRESVAPPATFETRQVSIPRVTLQSRLGWTPVLKALGVSELLLDADLPKASKEGGLRLTDLSTATQFSLTEKGAYVASSAAAVVTARGAAPAPVVLDRPFVWIVRHTATGIPLAVGLVESVNADPKTASQPLRQFGSASSQSPAKSPVE